MPDAVNAGKFDVERPYAQAVLDLATANTGIEEFSTGDHPLRAIGDSSDFLLYGAALGSHYDP